MSTILDAVKAAKKSYQDDVSSRLKEARECLEESTRRVMLFCGKPPQGVGALDAFHNEFDLALDDDAKAFKDFIDAKQKLRTLLGHR